MAREGDIGLVLSGGGAKGAFQAGVWKAMCELGLADRVRAISGTSVGAINGAAFATLRDPVDICRVWIDHVAEVATLNLRNLSLDAFVHAAENILSGKAFPFHGLLDRGALERVIRSCLPKKWPADAPTVTASTLECDDGFLNEINSSAYSLCRFRIDKEPDHARRVEKILASAAIPWGFDPVKFDGKKFVDGGWEEMGGDNIPVAPILKDNPEIDTVIVVRCDSREVDPEPIGEICRGQGCEGKEIIEVRPSSTLPGIFGSFLSDMFGLAGTSPSESYGGSPADLLGKKLLDIRRKLQIWSGTFAFDGDHAEQYLLRGYEDGFRALRDYRFQASLNW